MNLIFKQEYKSIKHLPIAELPDFTVITGANGAGKTHLLEAVLKGYLEIVDVQKDKIKYYNWSSLVTPDEQAIQPRSLEDNRNAICSAVADICNAYQEVILYWVGQHNAQYRDSPAVSVTKQQLYDAVDWPVPAAQHLAKSGNEIIAWYVHFAFENVNALIERAYQTGNAGEGFYTSTGQYQSKSLSRDNAFVLKQTIEKSTKPFFALTLDDCLRVYPLVSTVQDPFLGSLTGLFAGYVASRMKNALNKTLATEFSTVIDFLTPEKFLIQYGPAPWDVFNSVLAEAKLTFRFAEPSPDSSIPLRVRLHHQLSGVEINFSDLSSGERVLIALSHFLFFAQDSRQPTAMPELILLDEVDAPLHPSMTVDLLRTITNVIVGQYGRKVILATHSPSTVALAPEDSIHVMEVETKLLRKVSRDEGVQALTVGVPVLSINIANRRQVFVESFHDVTLYERIAEVAKPHLLPTVSISFMAAGHDKNGGCALLTSLVKQLTDAGNKAVFGIVDWDGTRTHDGNVRVLGPEARHSIENYLLDPILIGALLLREKAAAFSNTSQPLLEGRETYFHLRDFDDTRLQRVADAVMNTLGFALQDLKPVSYVNGRTVQVPKEYLHLRGHDLEERIQKAFDELKRFHREPMLKKEILHKILDDMPELLPMDFVSLLTSIQVG